MPAERARGGGLSNEAARLLREGLDLLDERQREVDGLIQQAEAHADKIVGNAEERALEIIADAQRQRAELEEQVAALRDEVAALREELAQARTAPPTGRGARGRPNPTLVAAAIAGESSGANAAPVAEAAQTGADADSAAATAPQSTTLPGEPTAVELVEAAEAAGTPRWGRPSTISAAQQTIRSRSSRPRWLPPWLPFFIVLLAAAGVVFANVDGVGGNRTASTSEPAVTTLQEPAPVPSPTDTSLALVAAAITATSGALVAASAPQSQTSATATPTATRATAKPTARPSAQTAVPTPLQLPAAQPSVTVPVAVPAEVSPEGPIVAAYTAYATYTVRPGDTLNRVATEFGVSGEAIMRTSGISDPNLLLPGQVLTIPRDSGWLYRVQPNETIEQIALRLGITVDELVMASTLSTPTVHAGDLLFIPNRLLAGPKR